MGLATYDEKHTRVSGLPDSFGFLPSSALYDEIMVPGGSVEHVNEEAGSVWLERITRTYPHAVWLNPVAQKHWDYSESTTIIRRLFSERMYPITIEGLEGAMKELVR